MIRVKDRIFVTEEGTKFVPVGFTVGVDVRTLTDSRMDQYFKRFTDHCGTVLRILHEPRIPEIVPRIELSPGVINPEFGPYLNRLISYAGNYDVRLLVNIWSGWADYPQGFFNESQWPAQEKVLDYLAEEWSFSDYIFAWELYNELSWDNDLGDRWITHMAHYFKERSQQLLTISAGNCMLGTPMSEIWSCPDLDFAAAHVYTSFHKDGKVVIPGGLAFGEGLPQRALNVPTIMHEIWKRCPSKPFLDTEIPGIPISWWNKLVAWNFSSHSAYAQSFLDVGKAYLANGAASPGITYWTNPMRQIDGILSELTPALYDRQAQFL